VCRSVHVCALGFVEHQHLQGGWLALRAWPDVWERVFDGVAAADELSDGLELRIITRCII